jgi:tripartite-type tricarboxylate transporter receptor subunit TctC
METLMKNETTKRSFLINSGVATLVSTLLPTLALGQANNLTSAGPIDLAKIVLGSPPGSTLDVFARRVAEALQPGYAKSTIVDNKPGASGQIAVSAVKISPADGTTILVTPMPMMGIYPHTYSKLPYDSVKDFIPVSLGAVFDLAFGVGPMVPESVKSMNDFFKWCQANPSKANFGSPASGSTPHFVGSMAGKAAKSEITHVPFRGMPAALLDMVGGQIAAVCGTSGDFVPFVESGKARILATTGAKRSRFLPSVPTLVEQGFSDIVINDWFGFFVPIKTPESVVQKLSAALKIALSSPVVVKLLDEKCLDAKWSTQSELAIRLKGDIERWGPIVKSLNFSADS